MLRIVCHSYKGGAGRTTAAANIAAALAKQGKSVLCLDLDLEGPGLHIVSGYPQVGDFHLQKYLREPSLGDWERAMDPREVEGKVVDVLSLLRDGPSAQARVKACLSRLEAGGELGKLHLLPSTQDVVPVSARGTYLERRLKELCTYFDDRYDYMIIDSASGIRSLSALALAISDLVLIFFRWSRQFFAGTLQMCQFMNSLTDTRQEREYWLISSAEPPYPENTVAAAVFRDRVAALKDLLRREAGETRVRRMFTVRETPELRWEERIVVFDEAAVDTDYDVIAKALVASTDCVRRTH